MKTMQVWVKQDGSKINLNTTKAATKAAQDLGWVRDEVKKKKAKVVKKAKKPEAE
jgi:hypothetical protein